MNGGDEPSARPDADDQTLASLVEQITRRLQDGDPIDVEVYAKLYPALEGPIRRMLPTLNDLTKLARSLPHDRYDGFS